jgi:glucose-1-phosphate thymidylyltransferase
MNIIIPMAGIGKRMRPHSLSVPKPLMKIAGKAIVQRLIEELIKSINLKVSNIGFVIGDFGKDVENELLNISKKVNSKGRIYYQKEAMGTAHAIYCADELLNSEVIVAFADTLFKADFKINNESEAVIWVYRVEDPHNYGVVKENDRNIVTDFIEKPKQKISDKAIVGIYYFKNGDLLKSEIKNIIRNKVLIDGEYQLTTVLENMKNKGLEFNVSEVDEWLDCGNKDTFISTNARILEHMNKKELLCDNVIVMNSKIINPCYIGTNVKISNSIIGPYVSIEENTEISKCIISDSIIYNNSIIKGIVTSKSIIGSNVEYLRNDEELNIGDFSNYKTDRQI